MQSTPVKTDLNTSCSFTPVRFVGSPRPKPTDNLGIHTRLAQIVRTLQENQIKWEAVQKRGTSLCLSIEALKTQALESKTEGATLYPEEMRTHCQKLETITGICEDISSSAQQSLQQLTALFRLSGNSSEVQYKSWSIEHFIKLAECAVAMYAREVEVKRIVKKEIAHSLQRSDLVFHSSAWEYPPFGDEDLRLRFKFLSVETDMR